jgi:hypothetical protein
MVETFIVTPEKHAEFMTFTKKYFEWIKKNTQLLKEVKSHKMFAQMFGGNWGGYVELWEFENFADCEKCFNRVMQDKKYMTTLYAEVMALIIPGTHSMSTWNSFP